MKLFTKEVIIGLTGVVALVVLYLGINFLKGIKLTPSHEYYITFKNAKGLATSSAVFADGYQIGIVKNISYDFNNPGTVVVQITVDDDVRIPVGTTAALSEGMLGGCTLNMTMGTNPKEEIAIGDTIVGSDDNGLMDQIAGVMPQVNTVLQHVDSLITTLNRVAGDPNIQRTFDNTQQLTANLTQGTDQLNHLLNNEIPTVLATINRVGENAESLTANLNRIDLQPTLDQVNRTIADVQELIAMMEDPNGNLGLLLTDTAVYSNLNATINSANNLLMDLKAHPKRYIHFSLIGRKDK